MVRRIWFPTLVLLVLVFLVMHGSLTLSTDAMKFPWILGGVCVILLLLEIVGGIKEGQKDITEKHEKEGFMGYRSHLHGLLWILAILPMIYFLGLFITIPIYLFMYLRSQGEKWLLCLIITLCVGIFFYFTFIVVLEIPFHEGLLLSYFRD